MPKLVMLRGLPGSGKSTIAKNEYCNDKNFKRVNKDDLRKVLGNYTIKDEKVVKSTETYLAEELLKRGKSVVVDDTNLGVSYYN